MSWFFHFFLITLLFTTVLGNEESATSREYLNAKFKETKDLLKELQSPFTKDRIADSESQSYKGKWTKLWTETAKTKRPRAINFSEQTFLVDGQQVYSIASNTNAVNNIAVVNNLQLPSFQEPTKFIKSFFWSGLQFLLVCQVKFCSIYQGKSLLELQNGQILQFNYLSPTDASFFIQENQLYLIISYSIDKYVNNYNTAPTIIYQWRGTNMIPIGQPILTPIVKSLATIHDEQSTILFFAIESNESAGTIYELDNKNNIEFIANLLNIGPITSTYSYHCDGNDFFLFTSNNDDASGIFWWDGAELRKVIHIPEIQSFSLVNVVTVMNDTFLLVCNLDMLHIFKITHNDCIKIMDLELNSGRVVEIKAWANETSLMLLIIKKSHVDTYYTELWNLHLYKEPSVTISTSETWKCLEELQKLLEFRKSIMEDLKSQWPQLLPASTNHTITNPLQLENLYLDGGYISLLEFDNSDELTLFDTVNLQKALSELEKSVEESWSSSERIVSNQEITSLIGKIVVDGDAYIQEFYVDRLYIDYLNHQKINIDNTYIPEADQNFSLPLTAKNISINNLEIKSLCGLDRDYWLLRNNVDQTRIDIETLSKSVTYNGTIYLEKETILNELNAKIINGIDMKKFLDDVFIIGSKQAIKGNLTYRGLVQIAKLYAKKINNISSNALITRYSNQSLSDVFIDKLEVQDLVLETINGVRIDKAARMSRENVIKGKIIINNLIIMDEFIVDENSSIPFVTPTQIYDTVVIYGNVFIENLEMDSKASLLLDHNLYNIHSIVDESWSKSKDQVLEHPIVFEKGMSIDELSCCYLNGLSEEDFVYVNISEIIDLENVTFSKFHFQNIVNATSALAEDFVEEATHYLKFKKPIRIRHLSVDNISIDRYNGISVEFIMQGNGTLKFDRNSEFEVIRVEEEMVVNQLQLEKLNLLNASIFQEALRNNKNLEVNVLNVDEINIKYLQIKNLCGNNLEEALQSQENFSNRLHKNLVIDGELNIEGSFDVEKINNKYPNDYIEDLKTLNLTDLIETGNSKNLIVMENLNVNSLNGYNVNDIFDKVLSINKKQSFHGDASFIDSDISYLTVKTINNKNISELKYIDEPCVFYGITTFLELFVKGDIITKTLNGKDVSQLQKGLQVLSLKNALNLHVFGNVFWEKSSSNLQSIDYLLYNAVTTNEDQFINFPVIFEKPVTVGSLYQENLDSSILEKVRETILDAVIDDINMESVIIKGTKFFKSDLSVNDLVVKNNVDIQYINGLNIEEVASKIFKKYTNDVVSAEITFLGQVEIGNLKTKSKIHGVPLYEIATYKKTMPHFLHFEHLIIQRNLSVFSLDGIQLDEFERKRVTINEDQELFGDVTFQNSVTVLNNSFVSFVNGIKPTNLVLNDARIPSVIYGKKTFASKLIIEGDVETVSINRINASSIFNNSILNDENVNIHGDVIFESNVEALSSVDVSGRINGFEPQHIMEDEMEQQKLGMNSLIKKESYIQQVISSSVNSSSRYSRLMLYLEEESQLKLHLPGVKSVRTMEIESTTLLDVYAAEDGAFCGLPCDCSCRRQYTAEISFTGNCSIQQDNSSSVTFNFYKPGGQFGLKIISQAISSSEYCSSNSTEPESSIILWIKLSRTHKEIQKLPIEIHGFVTDTQIFIFNDRLYLIMAIFYDNVRKSHSTESLVYEFNLQNNKAKLIQSIDTEGAKVLHVFQVTDVGVHVLIGCVKGKSESILLRFDQETQKFTTIRTFATGGSKHIVSVSGNDQTFVILNNPDIEALQIFAYESVVDNFVDYQSLYFDSRITSLSVFYSGDFGRSEAFVVTTTKAGQFFVYEYMFYGKFQLKISHWIEDIQTVAPFRHMDQNYLFIGFRSNSTIFKVIQQGLN